MVKEFLVEDDYKKHGIPLPSRSSNSSSSRTTTQTKATTLSSSSTYDPSYKSRKRATMKK
jgi:hypothetical protein